MNPHEEDWHGAQSDNYMDGNWRVLNAHGNPRCVVLGAPADAEALARFIASTPKMARFLRDELTATGHHKVCPNWFSVHTACSVRCIEMKGILVAAGVPLDDS